MSDDLEFVRGSGNVFRDFAGRPAVAQPSSRFDFTFGPIAAAREIKCGSRRTESCSHVRSKNRYTPKFYQ